MIDRDRLEQIVRAHVANRWPGATARVYDDEGAPRGWVLVVDRGDRHFECAVNPADFDGTIAPPSPRVGGMWRELDACLTAEAPGPVAMADVFRGLRVHVAGHRGVVADAHASRWDGQSVGRNGLPAEYLSVDVAVGSGASIKLIGARAWDRGGPPGAQAIIARLVRARDGNVVVADACLSEAQLEALNGIAIAGVPGLR